MIHIKSIKLTDFGRHRSVDANFQGNVVGLTGSNGLGKSTVLQALQFAYTGEIETSPAEPLANFIRRSGEDPPKFAEVESTFEADGKQGRIIRRVTRTTVTRKLYWDGAEKPITSDKEVSAILTGILGVDRKAIHSTVFIRQGEMASMFGAETDRREFYTRLLMLGHLAKVANVVETHRAHMAGTIQDLGAVRDAAVASYEEALTYDTAAAEALDQAPPMGAALTTARDVIAAFERQAEAAESLARAAAALSDHVGADADPHAWAGALRSEAAHTSAELEVLATKKDKHLAAVRAEISARQKLENTRQDSEVFNQLLKATDLLAAAPVLEDVAPAIETLERRLASFDRRAELEAAAPPRSAELVSLLGSLEVIEAKTEVAREAYSAERENYAATKSWCDARRSLIQMARSECLTGDGCPLCGSDASLNEEHLIRELEADEQKLAALVGKGKEASEAYASWKGKRDTELGRVKVLRSKVEADTTELKRLSITLSLTTRDATAADLESLKLQQVAYRESEFQVKGLRADVDRLKAVTRDKVCPDPRDVTSAELAYAESKDVLSHSHWSDNDATMEARAKLSLEQLRPQIDRLQSQIADVEAAAQRATQAALSLDAAMKVVPKGFYDDVLTGAAALSEKEAAEKVVLLDGIQQEHDAARGRREATSEGLRAASRKLDEIDLRAAEQRHRMVLVKDLELLRDTFKPAGASLEYLNYKFGQIAEMAADYLAESGADFMVAPSDETPLAFDFLRTDRENEVWMPQNRLSGGQRVRLAVAVLRAIHAMILPNVGLLVLDEPTTHLDEEAKRSMAEMLHTIGEEGTLQMIVCDHSPTLVDAFSDVISLPA